MTSQAHALASYTHLLFHSSLSYTCLGDEIKELSWRDQRVKVCFKY